MSPPILQFHIIGPPPRTRIWHFTGPIFTLLHFEISYTLYWHFEYPIYISFLYWPNLTYFFHFPKTCIKGLHKVLITFLTQIVSCTASAIITVIGVGLWFLNFRFRCLKQDSYVWMRIECLPKIRTICFATAVYERRIQKVWQISVKYFKHI